MPDLPDPREADKVDRHLHFWVDNERLAAWLMETRQRDRQEVGERPLTYTDHHADLAIAQAKAMRDAVNMLLAIKEGITQAMRAGYHNDPGVRDSLINPLFAFYNRHRLALPDNPPPFSGNVESLVVEQSNFDASADPTSLEKPHAETNDQSTRSGSGGDPPRPDQEPVRQPDQPKEDV